MPKEESTARYITVRLNPKTSEYDRQVLEILDEKARDGFKAKAVIIDAVLRADGATPEMFTDGLPLPSMMLAKMERLLDEFARHIVASIQRDGVQSVASQVERPAKGKKASPFAQSFLQSIKDRQNEQD